MAGRALSLLSSQTTCLYLQDVTHDLSLFLRAAVSQFGQLVFQQGNLPLKDLHLLFQTFLQTQTGDGAGQEAGDTCCSQGTPIPSPSPSPAAQPSAHPPAAPALLGTASAQRCAPQRAHSGHPAAAPCGWRSPAAVREAGKSAQHGNIGGHPKSGCLQGFISHTTSKVLNAGNIYRPQRTNPKCTLYPLPTQLLFLKADAALASRAVCKEHCQQDAKQESAAPYLEGKVPVLLGELVDFAVHLALLRLQILALLQGLVQAHQQAVGEQWHISARAREERASLGTPGYAGISAWC